MYRWYTQIKCFTWVLSFRTSAAVIMYCMHCSTVHYYSTASWCVGPKHFSEIPEYQCFKSYLPNPGKPVKYMAVYVFR